MQTRGKKRKSQHPGAEQDFCTSPLLLSFTCCQALNENKRRGKGNVVFPSFVSGPHKAARCEPAGPEKAWQLLGEGNQKHVDSRSLDRKLVAAMR